MATSDKLIQVKDLQKHYNKGALHALDGVTATVDLHAGTAAVTCADSVSDDVLRKAVEDAGYDVVSIG